MTRKEKFMVGALMIALIGCFVFIAVSLPEYDNPTTTYLIVRVKSNWFSPMPITLEYMVNGETQAPVRLKSADELNRLLKEFESKGKVKYLEGSK
jgi:hypothetical protein